MHPLLALPQFGLAIRSGRTVFGQRCHSAEQLFDAIDRDHSGAISLDELRRGLSRLDIKGGDAEAFIRTIDSSKDGEVSRVELVAALDSDELQRQAYLNTLKSKAAANLRQRRRRQTTVRNARALQARACGGDLRSSLARVTRTRAAQVGKLVENWGRREFDSDELLSGSIAQLTKRCILNTRWTSTTKPMWAHACPWQNIPADINFKCGNHNLRPQYHKVIWTRGDKLFSETMWFGQLSRCKNWILADAGLTCHGRCQNRTPTGPNFLKIRKLDPHKGRARRASPSC